MAIIERMSECVGTVSKMLSQKLMALRVAAMTMSGSTDGSSNVTSVMMGPFSTESVVSNHRALPDTPPDLEIMLTPRPPH